MSTRRKNTKTVIIGLDGVPFSMIKNFAENGIMPNTRTIIRDALFTRMASAIPEVSCVAWSSVITGANPARHAIFGFMDLAPNSYRMTFPNFNDLKQPPFWDLWQGRSVIINVPATYPVHEMSGVHISGFVSIDFQKSVYPASLIRNLKELDYRLDVDARKAHTCLDSFLEDLDKTLHARIQAYRYLWKSSQWQTFMLVFTATDRLMHFLWDAYEDENHKYHAHFLDHFRKIDRVIGEINNSISDDSLLVILSDHGFERLDADVYINYFLAENGFLRFEKGRDADLKNIAHETKAFALDPARIYINRTGKYPCGSVEPAEAPDILSQLETLFASLTIDGKKVIRHIYRKEQIYEGPYLNNAPDLVLVAAEGFNLKANLKTEKLADKGPFTGKHTQDSAFLAVKGPVRNDIVPQNPSVSDVKAVIENSIAAT